MGARAGTRGAERHAPAASYLVSLKNNSDGIVMKSRFAFEFTVRKMLRQNGKLYFWTFTFREVHSLRTAMGLWNQFLTLLKRKLQFRGVRVLELHDDHGCHFHVITNRRFSIENILAFSARYGFGRLNVKPVSDSGKAIRYLCKYLSKPRPGCLKRTRLWSAFGNIERTRVKDVLTDTPMTRLVRRIMGKRSVDDELAGIELESVNTGFRPERNFQRAVEKAKTAYLYGFDPEYFERQKMWSKLRQSGLVNLSHPWSSGSPLEQE
jgi:hypothetical protein